MTARATAQPSGGDGAGLTLEQIMAMRREAEANWPRLGRMQCGELADVAVDATRAVLALTTEAVCTDWIDTAELNTLQDRLDAAERVNTEARALLLACLSHNVDRFKPNAELDASWWPERLQALAVAVDAYDAVTNPDTGGDHA